MKLTGVISLVVVSGILLFSTGCKKDKGTLTLQIKARYQGQDIVFNKQYTDPDGNTLSFSLLQFYLSHLTLIKTDNSQTEISSVNFVDVADPTSLSLSFNNLQGDFKGIQFGCGVDSVQNSTAVKTNGVGPLETGTNYWSMLQFQFQVLEGKWDTTLSHGFLTQPLVYHVGTNPLYTHSSLNHSFSVCCSKTTTLTIYLDVDKIFSGGPAKLNLPADDYTQCANAQELQVAAKFANNFSQAFTF
jgi:hypothetical protein